jgi:hypothetical protein
MREALNGLWQCCEAVLVYRDDKERITNVSTIRAFRRDRAGNTDYRCHGCLCHVWAGSCADQPVPPPANASHCRLRAMRGDRCGCSTLWLRRVGGGMPLGISQGRNLNGCWVQEQCNYGRKVEKSQSYRMRHAA